jgi:ribosome-associated protein
MGIENVPGKTVDHKPLVPPAELEFRFVRASGPGGQNVNKVSTAVELRFDLGANVSLSPEIKARLRRLAGKRVSAGDVLTIDARRHRSQEANRRDAVERLEDLVRAASVRPRRRVATKPTRASKERRIAGKKQRAGVKQGRGRVAESD